MWSNFVMWINYNLFPVPYFAPHDKFTMYAVLSLFVLFWHNIRRTYKCAKLQVVMFQIMKSPSRENSSEQRLMFSGENRCCAKFNISWRLTSAQATETDPSWQHFSLSRLFKGRGSSRQNISLPLLTENQSFERIDSRFVKFWSIVCITQN